MARSVILLVSSDPGRLHAWQQAVRRAGLLPLPASTGQQANNLLSTVCPALLIADAELCDGRALRFLATLRTHPRLGQMPVIVLGSLTPDERRMLQGDPCAAVQTCADTAALITLMQRLLAPLHL